jgi:putative ABC transport system permease protein
MLSPDGTNAIDPGGRHGAHRVRTPILWRASLRYLARHPAQIGLAILGVALGVAVVVAVDLANASATRAFALSTEAVTGRTTHQVLGGPEGLPDDAYRRLVLAAGIERAAPVVEEDVTVAIGSGRAPDPAAGRLPGAPLGDRGGRGRLLHLLGIDPFAEQPFRPYLARGRSGLDLAPFLTRPRAAVLAAATARELGVAAGGELPIRLGGAVVPVTVVGTIAPADETSRRALADLLVVDVATAQEMTGRLGRLSRIDLIVPAGAAGDRLLARARAVLPPGATIVTAAARSRSTETMTRSFRLNLTALSLLALVCGVFLIYNTITFSVVQRRTLLGTLRALGVTRGQVFSLVLAEAAAVAVVGSGAGLLAGIALGTGLVRLVTQTINDLYFVLAVRGLAIPAATLAKGAAVGIGATLLAAIAPAYEATAAPPRAVLTRSSLETRLRRALPRAVAAGALLLAAGGGLLLVRGGIVVAFVALFAVIVGCAVLAPPATVVMMRLLRRPMGALFGILGRMAAGGVVAALSRTGVAIAALVVAVSVTVGIGVMIGSFRSTVVRWLDDSLHADFYVSAPSAGGGFRGGALDPALAERAAALPGVDHVESIRRVELAGSGTAGAGPVRLVAIDVGRASFSKGAGSAGRSSHTGRAIELAAGDPRQAGPAFAAGEVIVSEAFAEHRRVRPGSTLVLRTAAGDRPFRVAGVFYDYASDQGIVMIDHRAYVALWKDPTLSGFSVALAPGADADAVERDLRESLVGSVVSVQSNGALKRGSLAIFDRTFLITGVLRLLAGLVAGIGVLSSLMALQLERARELAVLRANGLTPRQVWGLVTAQTGLMGLAAGLLSLPVGLALAAIMIFVINRRSFGWTVVMEIPPGVLAEAVGLALAAALLAGVYPAWKMARTSPARALREE